MDDSSNRVINLHGLGQIIPNDHHDGTMLGNSLRTMVFNALQVGTLMLISLSMSGFYTEEQIMGIVLVTISSILYGSTFSSTRIF